MKKLLLLILVLLLVSCSERTPLYFNVLENSPSDHHSLGLTFLNHLQQEDYDSAYALIDEEMKKEISRVDLTSLWISVVKDHGFIKEVRGFDEKKHEHFTSYYYDTVFERDGFQIEIGMNEEGRIVGFFFHPSKDSYMNVESLEKATD